MATTANVSDKMQDLGKDVSKGRGHNGGSSASGEAFETVINTAKEYIPESTLRAAKTQLTHIGEYADQAGEIASKAWKSASSTVKKHPWEFALAGFGVGVVLAILLSRRN